MLLVLFNQPAQTPAPPPAPPPATPPAVGGGSYTAPFHLRPYVPMAVPPKHRRPRKRRVNELLLIL